MFSYTVVVRPFVTLFSDGLVCSYRKMRGFANTRTVRLLAKEPLLFGQRSEFLRFCGGPSIPTPPLADHLSCYLLLDRDGTGDLVIGKKRRLGLAKLRGTIPAGGTNVHTQYRPYIAATLQTARNAKITGIRQQMNSIMSIVPKTNT